MRDTTDSEPPPGVPLGGDAAALAALADAARGSLGDLDLDEVDATLDGLAAVADLDDVDRFIVAVAAFANFDDRVGRAIGLLHDDVSRTRPSIGLMARLIERAKPSERMGTRAEVLHAAGPNGTLAHLGVIDIVGAYGDPDVPMANREIVLHPRVVATLLRGGPLVIPDPVLGPALTLDRADDRLSTPDSDTRALDWIERLLALRDGAETVGLLCAGPEPRVALDVARAFAEQADSAVLKVNISLALSGDETPASLGRIVRRESVLLRALPVWLGLPDPASKDDPHFAHRLAQLFIDAPWPLIIHGEHAWTPPSDEPLTLVHVPAVAPSLPERSQLWQRTNISGTPASAEVAEILAAAFVVPRNAIRAARLDAAASEALLGGDSAEHLRRGAHRQAAARLVHFAIKVTPRATWSDIKVPPGVTKQLREIDWRIAHRARVYDELGFGGTASNRRGFLALFAGPSGTGKTMAAEILAGGQGFDLYKVDLSALVSKYIGETEKNLSQIFADAESAHAILFFDEADALFGKRSEVKDAHDRYANIEINYLLQRVEAYDGVVVLATNMRQNMDEAFLRRLDMVVEFPFPDAATRAEIWGDIWPERVAVDPSMDFLTVSQKFRLSGGSIRNSAVDAAFRAAARNGHGENLKIEADDIYLALAREYQKLGRPVLRADFGEAYDTVLEGVFAGSRTEGRDDG